MAKVLIAGCGDLGTGLAKDLVSQGHQVTGIRRSGTEFPEGVEGITGDLRELSDDVLPDVALIFLIMTPNERSEAGYRQAYYETAQVLVRRYQHSISPVKLVFVSSTSVYGQNQGEWIDEQSPAQPNSVTAKVLIETETLLQQTFTCVSARCSGIYGPSRFALMKKVMKEQAWGANSWTNRVHRDDVVAALLLLAELILTDQDMPAHVIVTDQTPVSMWEVKLWLATSLKVAIKANLQEGLAPQSGKRILADYLRNQGWQLAYPSYVAGYRKLLIDFQQSLEG
ncbi:NAD-dependent epimerase/dehydratase family protein [Marinomonas posidonica]|uniref:NAD-dependent epimerase/dehydratase n=1 Tax=Marinomonas posidonica (strain CECT 7376 / NCIMB 14433 / IVIA-Po-181) TaxID=491952 RepID=F6CV66_MARPP|nr:NAD-dependent epimerase/dehydratase family protein [Marinomonas posidonica]AEF56486.1 NAD-dependent epimerase/dehydratase [Marinomonas posidonica IVIA-Po-181]